MIYTPFKLVVSGAGIQAFSNSTLEKYSVLMSEVEEIRTDLAARFCSFFFFFIFIKDHFIYLVHKQITTHYLRNTTCEVILILFTIRY